MTGESLYIVAGELSGDTHAAGLLRALLEMRPGLRVEGVGGPKMVEATGGGVRDWVEDAAVVGVWEVVRHYGWFRERFREMLEQIRSGRPRVLVLVDYPGFNLRLARAVREQLPETRIVYYISPQVWAWNRGRARRMARFLDEMLCIFPFEEEIFREAGLRTRFVGHPLVDDLAGERALVEREPDLVGLFPGSRGREVGRLFPVMLEAAGRLASGGRVLRFEAPAASQRLAATMREMASRLGPGGVTVTDGGSHRLMQRAACGVIASGTATLEAACFGLPYCLVYKVAWPTYLLGRLLVKLPHIGLVNILAGREVVEEFIQGEADAFEVEQALGRFLGDDDHRGRTTRELLETAAMLGEPGSFRRAAEAVDSWL
jgi:lipid-A-disaccharide synthase